MYYSNHYVIDWEKVKTFEDLKRIMIIIDFTFEPDHPGIQEIIDLVQLEPKPKTGWPSLDFQSDGST